MRVCERACVRACVCVRWGENKTAHLSLSLYKHRQEGLQLRHMRTAAAQRQKLSTKLEHEAEIFGVKSENRAENLLKRTF